jgi:hypothetical protein
MATERKDGQRGWFAPSEALRQLQEMGTQLTGAAQSMADELSKSSAGQFEPMVRLGERAIELSTLWVAPVRALLEEQQELMDAVATWAEEQRKLSERFADIAKRHREVTDQVTAAIKPALDQADWLSGRQAKRATKTTTKKA